MKLLSARIRGAIGIYDGLGVDEINVDFTKFEQGPVCVFGQTGSGKTTFIENLVPFRKLFTRSGSLANHFRLKDSCRDLWYQIGPDQYRFLININADSGKIESYVYRNGEVLNADGKEGSYNAEIEKLVGSQELYATSMFQPQDRLRFSELPPERREELFNLGDIQAKSKYASEQSKALQSAIAEVTSRIAQHESTVSDMAGIEESIKIGEQIVEVREKSIAGIQMHISLLNSDLGKLQEKAKEQATIKAELAAIDKAIAQLKVDKTNVGYEHEQKLSKLDTEIGVTTTSVEAQEKLLDAERLARMRELVAKRAELAAEIERHVEAHGKHVQAVTELSSVKNDLRIAETKLLSESDKAEDALTEAKAATELIYKVPCIEIADEEERKRCQSCQFLTNAVAAEKSLERLEREAVEKKTAFESTIKALKAKIATAEKFVADSPFDEVRAKACKAELAAIDAQKPADYIQRAEIAGQRLAGLNDQLAYLKEQRLTISEDKLNKVRAIVDLIDAKVAERAGIAAAVNSTIDNAILDKNRELQQARAEEIADSNQLTAAKKDIETFKEKLEQRFTAEFKLTHDRKTLAELESDQADWTHIALILGRSGVQSYIIESLAVHMTEFANELLKKYGRPWTIEILTSIPTADGKSEKTGFFVFINTPDGRREIGMLSGGQKVWVDTILQHAVANALQQRSGHILQTKITDEADAALDSEGRYAYLEATQLASQESGIHNTLIISHSQEIQNAISQRIRFVRGKGIEIERD